MLNQDSDSEESSTHEARDRELFDEIAHDYARKDLDPGAAAAREHRLVQTLADVETQGLPSMLEVGCGAGYAARYLEGHYSAYEGIDYSKELIAFAEAHNQNEKAVFKTVNVKDLPTHTKYDIIFMVGVLHHLDDEIAVMTLLKGHLKPGGWLVVNEPQRGNPLISAMRYIRKKIDRGYSEDQIEYNGNELHSLFTKAGYEEVTVKPQGFFSTPFAEVVLPLSFLSAPLSRLMCRLDRWIESRKWSSRSRLSWNLVARGRMGESTAP